MEELVQQLVYIDENINQLTELYISSTPAQERMKHFFHLYVLEVEELLKIHHKKESISSFSKVYIGSKVTIRYEEDNETEEYVSLNNLIPIQALYPFYLLLASSCYLKRWRVVYC